MSSVQLCHSRKEDVTAPCVINCPRMWNNNEVSKKRKLEESKPAPAPTFAFGAPPAPTFGFGTPLPSPTDTIRRTGVARRTPFVEVDMEVDTKALSDSATSTGRKGRQCF